MLALEHYYAPCGASSRRQVRQTENRRGSSKQTPLVVKQMDMDPHFFCWKHPHLQVMPDLSLFPMGGI